MDYKQKYEHALNNFKKIMNANKDNEELVDFIEFEYPELKESEGEKVRKAILQIVNITEPSFTLNSFGVDKKDMVDWLEKQKDHEDELDKAYKTADEVQYRRGYEAAKREFEMKSDMKVAVKYIYPKFRVGDVIEPAKPNGHYVPVRVKYIGEGNYSCESDDHKAFLSFPICHENNYVLTEQKPREWENSDNIEYVRTDAFIEKACGWIKENVNKYLYNTGERNEYIPTCSTKLAEDFAKYMKGE